MKMIFCIEIMNFRHTYIYKLYSHGESVPVNILLVNHVFFFFKSPNHHQFLNHAAFNSRKVSWMTDLLQRVSPGISRGEDGGGAQ